MAVKLEILTALLPIAALEPLTQEAIDSLPPAQACNGLIAIYKFPFRIGRESRLIRNPLNGRYVLNERPKLGDRHPTNELYLLDTGEQLHISREHLQITKTSSGYQLTDRGSASGSTVSGTRLGGKDQGGQSLLLNGDIITLGSPTSPFQYRFFDLSDIKVHSIDMNSIELTLTDKPNAQLHQSPE